MLIKLETSPYNDRRHGRPWIAKVTGWVDGKPQQSFGCWVGKNGEAGVLTIDAQPGDIVRHGQKDNRRPQDSLDDWHVVDASGVLQPTTRVEAFELSLTSAVADPFADFSDDQILAEARRRGLVA